LEYVSNSRGFHIVIDYAVTPDSLSKLYALIQQINTNKTKIIAVFGACGERDRGKRPIMGEIVSRYADYIILTNEDPYNEEPMGIINDIFSGIPITPPPASPPYQGGENKKGSKTEGENLFRILDRRQAIKKALQIAKPGDYIIVTGKGAEETMAIGKKKIPWNDRKVILEELSSRTSSGI
jgi:UDP-N-acetylmuramoyl-L-alanyl-D-glutamate--2,6-diaminopimelate ligase